MDGTTIVIGSCVGLIVGLTGVGGGALMTPLLIGGFRLSPALAIGTDLWFAAFTKSGGAWAHHRHGHVDYRIAGLLLAGSLPAAAATLAAMRGSDAMAGSARVLAVSLGTALLLTALAVAHRPFWHALGLRLAQRLSARRQAALTVAAGALLGALVSLSSVGAGAVGATLILLLHPTLSAQRLVGTDIAHAVPLTLVAGIGHATLGHVQWALLPPLLAGSLPGIWLGARLSRSMPERLVRALVCASLVFAGLKALH